MLIIFLAAPINNRGAVELNNSGSIAKLSRGASMGAQGSRADRPGQGLKETGL
jgi:hypothetical protein